MSKKIDSRDILNTNNPALYEDDGLALPDVGSWALTKYRNIGTYCSIFVAGMRNKWDSLVYIDLFAGAGKSKIRGTETILPGSPLLALNSRTPFDKYIFCEEEREKHDSLVTRVRILFPERNCTFLFGDSNRLIDEILKEVPRASRENRVLSFCFVDPFNTSQLKFESIQRISRIFVDFIILIPSYMDINRNFASYYRKEDPSIDELLGLPNWREDWDSRSLNPKVFGQFVLGLFCARMKSIGYICRSPHDIVLVRAEEDKNQPLYHLGYFSRSSRGLDFWRKTQDNSSKQKILDFEFGES